MKSQNAFRLAEQNMELSLFLKHNYAEAISGS
jgi:hypothetical protein